MRHNGYPLFNVPSLSPMGLRGCVRLDTPLHLIATVLGRYMETCVWHGVYHTTSRALYPLVMEGGLAPSKRCASVVVHSPLAGRINVLADRCLHVKVMVI